MDNEENIDFYLHETAKNNWTARHSANYKMRPLYPLYPVPEIFDVCNGEDDRRVGSIPSMDIKVGLIFS